jgi:hypothetical protein
MKHIFPLVIFVALMFAFSCRPTRKIQTALTKKDTTRRFVQKVFSKVRSRKIDFNTFSAKIKVGYTDKEGVGPDLTVFVRMRKDSVIWLSINATVFSYEAFRVMITHDSVIVQNKKDKQVQFRALSYLQELTHLPFDFSTVQDLILGNPIFLDSNIIAFNQNQSSISMLTSGKLFKNLMTLSNNDFVLQHSKLDDINATRNRTCDLTYSDYEYKNGLLFSAGRKIIVAEKSKLDIDMNIKQYSFNEILSYPFNIPKNYKRN